ncbi:MAG TPA: hypothetical protein VKK19_10190 [Candidatus Dormibacteraeota bacterium]|nr:hypothetical protein [Candidatus Dormibacteraeota bacterium]
MLAQKVTAFPSVVGDGQRLAAFGHNSLGPAEPALPATPQRLDLIVNTQFG